MTHLPYNKNLKANSRKLRNHSTFGEILLWKQLRAKQMRGYTFNRQKPILHYIVDFYCKPLNLVIEVDGSSHIGREKQDAFRQKELESLGLYFLRFEDEWVKKEIGLVAQAIEEWIIEFEKSVEFEKRGGSGA